ncbi:hypothetical protein [Lacticaseibacillus hulanensis]|uniref:hypothetical protein n=1 Tax=Lacticaseibacillus hulanensis TaxID=2493111 RepID=UPI000FDAD1F7|nr:hypothetical protein [Lacticaseibacillus hulanensis]
MRDRRLWRLLWLRYRAIIGVLAVAGALITAFLLRNSHGDYVLSHAQYLRAYHKDPGAFSPNYHEYVLANKSFYAFLHKGDLFPMANGGVVLSLLLLLLSLVAGIMIANSDLRGGFMTFCERAGWRRTTFYYYRTALFAGVFSAIAIVQLLVLFTGYGVIVGSEYVGLNWRVAILIILYNVVWLNATFGLGQLIGSVFGRTFMASVMQIVLVIVGAAALDRLYLSFSGFRIDSPATDYWRWLVLGVVVLAFTWALQGYVANHVRLEDMDCAFTVAGAKVITLGILLVAIWVMLGVGNDRGDITGLIIGLVLMVVAALLWLGGDGLLRRIQGAK